MKMLRLLLFVFLGIIVWRMVRIALRSMQGPRRREGEDPLASARPPQRKSDLGEIKDAEFEDITDTPPPKNPPPTQ